MPRESTHAKLLEAGMAVLLEDAFGVLSRGMTLEPVWQKAGFSHQTLHRYYPRPTDDLGKAKFIDELVMALASSPTPVAGELTERIATSLTEAEGDPRRVIREVCKWDFTTIREHNSVLHALAVFVFARKHKKAMSSLRGMYRKYDQLIIAGMEAVLTKWGGSLRKPFTPALLALTLTAIVEGLTLRWLASPEDVPDALFGDIAVALVASVIDVEQSHQHIDDVAAPVALEVMRQFQKAQLTGLPGNPKRAIIDAARHEFKERGYFATTLTHISVSAKVPIPMLKKLFPSKAAIVVSGLRSQFEELRDNLVAYVGSGIDEVEIVKQYLVWLASFADQNKVMTGALMAVVAHDTAQSPETAKRLKEELNLPELIAPTIEAGQQKGMFTTVEPSSELAAILTNTLLLRCFTRQHQQPEEIAATIGNVFLGGMLVRK